MKKYQFNLMAISLKTLLCVILMAAAVADAQNTLFLAHYNGDTPHLGMDADYAVGDTAVYSNGGTISTTSKFGAGSLDASGNTTTTGNWTNYSTTSNFNVNEGTIDLWLQTDNWADGTARAIWSTWNGWGGAVLIEKQSTDNIYITWSDNSGNWFLNSGPLTVDSSWHHFAFEWDLAGGTAAMYLDGTGLDYAPSATPWAWNGNLGSTFEVGTQQGGWNAWPGLIEEVRIMDTDVYGYAAFTPPILEYPDPNLPDPNTGDPNAPDPNAPGPTAFQIDPNYTIFLCHYDGNTDHSGKDADYAIGDTAVYANGGTISATSKFDAGSLDASSNSTASGNQTSYATADNFNVDEGTVEMWLYVDNWADSTDRAIWSTWNGWGGAVLIEKKSTDNLYITWSDNSGNWFMDSTPLSVPDGWHHFAFEWDLAGGTAAMYLDGIGVDWTPSATPWAWNGSLGSVFEVGTLQGGWNAWPGLIEEVRISNVERYQGQNFNLQKEPWPPTAAPPDPVCGDSAHPIPEGDATGDCVVDLRDFALVASYWATDNRP